MGMSGVVAAQFGGDCRDLVQLLETLIGPLREQLDIIRRQVARGADRQAYTVVEAAARLDLTRWTVRQACNHGRIRARKVPGRGKKGQWRIPHDELVRVQNEGLLPASDIPRPLRRAHDLAPATGSNSDRRRNAT